MNPSVIIRVFGRIAGKLPNALFERPDCGIAAESNLEIGELRTSLNRSYYAFFHAMRSANALKGFDSSKHSGVIA